MGCFQLTRTEETLASKKGSRRRGHPSQWGHIGKVMMGPFLLQQEALRLRSGQAGSLQVVN